MSSSSTEPSPSATPSITPSQCRVLVILDKSYFDLHGEGAVALYKSSIDLAAQYFQNDLEFGLDTTIIVDETNSIIGDNQSQLADYVTIRERLEASTDPALAEYGDFCTHMVVTSRSLTSDSTGIGGGNPCTSSALALVSDENGSLGVNLVRTVTAHEIGHVLGADHV
jgi:hypothetical protein